MKYIRYEHMGIIMFSERIEHIGMHKMLGTAETIVSAGFVDETLTCYGISYSLGDIESRYDEDTAILHKLLGVQPNEKLIVNVVENK